MIPKEKNLCKATSLSVKATNHNLRLENRQLKQTLKKIVDNIKKSSAYNENVVEKNKGVFPPLVENKKLIFNLIEENENLRAMLSTIASKSEATLSKM